MHRPTVFLFVFSLTLLQLTEVRAQQSQSHGTKLGDLHVENGHVVQHRAYWIRVPDISHYQTSKSSTIDGDFDVNLPNGLPRSGAPGFVMEYEIIFGSDDADEGIDYFAYSAPSGWTITGIGAPPPQTACAGNPHTSIISGFSASSAYWGGDFGGGVVTPGSPGTYPTVGNRSFDLGGCGAFATETSPAAADTHTFSITLTPQATGHCPGSTTGALPLCCTGTEISAGSPPPVGSEPYFQEMMAASDGNADVSGDVYYYLSIGCPFPFIDLQKWPQEAGSGLGNCASTFVGNPFPYDTLWVTQPPGGQGEFCYGVANIANVLWSDTWGYTQCETIEIQDDSLGEILNQGGFALDPGSSQAFLDDSLVSAPDVNECWDNEAVAVCTTPPGSDYVLNVGIQTGQTNNSTPGAVIPGLGIDDASICSSPVLPVELVSFDARVDDHRVRLNWITATETNNAGFEIEHQRPDGVGFRTVGFVEGAGTTMAERRYSYVVSDVGPGMHRLRLKQLDFDGAFEYSEVVEVAVDVPGTHLLSSVYPNPFNPQTRFNLIVSRDQHVRVDVFDATGRSVGRLYDAPVVADSRVTFELQSGNLSSGTYLIRVVGDYFSDTRQVTLTK